MLAGHNKISRVWFSKTFGCLKYVARNAGCRPLINACSHNPERICFRHRGNRNHSLCRTRHQRQPLIFAVPCANNGGDGHRPDYPQNLLLPASSIGTSIDNSPPIPAGSCGGVCMLRLFNSITLVWVYAMLHEGRKHAGHHNHSPEGQLQIQST